MQKPLEPAACLALNDADFSIIPDAPTQLMVVQNVDATAAAPAHCYVKGYISPNFVFELKLPSASWNGKLLEVGCGGFCGVLLDAYAEPGHDCDLALRKGYACIASDLGHRSTIPDGKWAYNNPQAVFDFSFRAAHVVALAGKAIAHELYAQRPKKSYFWGCSTGGRQGLVSAQHFPRDFDGILVGAPTVNMTGRFAAMLWNDRAMKDEEGRPLIRAEDARNVRAAVVATCDMNDGVVDGLIGDPRRCKFDPQSMVCGESRTGGCLSSAQVSAVRKVLTGPVDSRGESLRIGGLSPEVNLDELNQIRRGGQSRPQFFSGEFFRYMGFMPAPGPNWKNSDFDFDRDMQRLGLAEAQFASTNPDLRRFKAAGGKMIVYQGWSDVPVSPLPTIDYYETVERTMGGRKATQDFLRLFVVPGMEHCVGGPGAAQIDLLTYIEEWVEAGKAPDMMLGFHVNSDNEADWNFPLDPAKIGFTRPIYPYPTQTHYQGRGDPKSHTSFKPVAPR